VTLGNTKGPLADAYDIMGREYTAKQSIGGDASPSVEWVAQESPLHYRAIEWV
jgi:hypothetical protein